MYVVEFSWNVMAHGDAQEGKWRGNRRKEWVASTLHTTSEHGVSSITTADAHTSAASSRLNWRLRRFKWTPPFRRKTKYGFCACAMTFQTQSTVRTSLLQFSPWRQNLTSLSSRSDDKNDTVIYNHNWSICYINICKYTRFRLISVT
jgi:hypothetical protein